MSAIPHLMPATHQILGARALAPSSAASACDEEAIQRASESIRFAGGEWLILESWHYPLRRAVGSHRLYYQASADAPRESLGDVDLDDAGADCLRDARPLLFKTGGRCALVLGRYVFQRWERSHGPWWYRVATRPLGAAPFFLRAWLRDGAPSLHDDPGRADYAFGHLDIERNVLVTSREHADPRLPQYLVYSAAEYGSPWRFDEERTRRVNGMQRSALHDPE